MSLTVVFLAGRWSVDRDGSSLPDDDAMTAAAGRPVVMPLEQTRPAMGAEGDDPLDLARELIRDGRPRDALALVEAHLSESGTDAEALFLLSDLCQMTGDVDAALEPLLDILRFPPTPEAAERARQRLELLINAREQQLIHAGDLAALVAYFERLVLAEPTWDGHRLKLARWLARSGATADAARLLREVGTVGVSEVEIEALAREIELADTRLPVERRDGAMFARAVVAGSRGSGSFRLLVDTGATMTGMTEERLVSLGAERVGERVTVHTAAGVVELPVYRLSELSVGSIVLRDLPVLGFEVLPGGADGLLGTDVLHRLSGDLPAMVGRPGDPR